MAANSVYDVRGWDKGVVYLAKPKERYDAHCHAISNKVLSTELIKDFIILKWEQSPKYIKIPTIIVSSRIFSELIGPTLQALLPPILGASEVVKCIPYPYVRKIENVKNAVVKRKDCKEALDYLHEEYKKIGAAINPQINNYIVLISDVEMAFIREYERDVDNIFFKSQIDELKYIVNLINYTNKNNELKIHNKIHPFLAVDPRRKNMAKLIIENVWTDGDNEDEKVFRGIKLYAQNGYSPTDPFLFGEGEDDGGLIKGLCLYAYCVKHNIPITTHCSRKGAGTYVHFLQINGDTYENNELVHNDPKGRYKFIGNTIRDRAKILNHPQIWNKVLQKYSSLKICFAHFGEDVEHNEKFDGSEDIKNLSPWRKHILTLMKRYPNVYTDLSCIDNEYSLKRINKIYSNNKVINFKERTMYGSDYFLNLLDDSTMKVYYERFKKTFDQTYLDSMMFPASFDCPTQPVYFSTTCQHEFPNNTYSISGKILNRKCMKNYTTSS